MLIDPTSDISAHYVTAIVEGVCGIAVLYASYRIASLKLWIKETMASAIKEGCPGKAEFESHIKADEKFQVELSDKLAESARQHRDHYAHASKTAIHQPSMSSATLEAKFETISAKVAAVGDRVSSVAKQIEELRRT